MNQNRLKQFVIDWNNRFPFDRIYREKYNIAFNSPQHRSLSQIYIYLDILEDKMFNKHKDDYIKYENFKEEIKKDGKYLRDRENVVDEKIEDLFDDIKF